MAFNSPSNQRSFERKGYLKKALTAREIEQYRPQEDFKLFWALWAAKESAYKSSVKCGNRNQFNPQKIEVSRLKIAGTRLERSADFETMSFDIKGEISDEFVHLVSSSKLDIDKPLKMAHRNISSTVESDMKKGVRRLLFENTGPFKSQFDKMGLEMDSEGLFPILPGYDLSLSHDYGLVAIALRKT